MTVVSGGESIFAVSNGIWAESDGLSLDGIYLTPQQAEPMVEYITYAEDFAPSVDGELHPGVRFKLYDEKYDDVEYFIPSGREAWAEIGTVGPGRYIAVSEESFKDADARSGYQYFFGLIVPEEKMSKRFKEASAIGIIGGADGPTAVFMAKPKADGQWQKALERCKAVAIPRETRVTGEQLKQHLKEEYDAYEVPVPGGKRLALKVTVLMNYYSEAVAQPPMPSEDDGISAWREWAERSHMDIAAARDIPDERYGLEYVFLAVPRNAKTERFYTEAEKELSQPKISLWQRLFGRRTPPARANKMVFGIELSTGHWQLDDGCKTLMDEVMLWRGVTREDIERKTPAFMAYAAAMRDTGRI